MSSVQMTLKDKIRFNLIANRVKFCFLTFVLLLLATSLYHNFLKPNYESVLWTWVIGNFIGVTLVILALKQRLLPIAGFLLFFYLTYSYFDDLASAGAIADQALNAYCFFLLILDGKDLWTRQPLYLTSWLTLYFLGTAIPLWNKFASEWDLVGILPIIGMSLVYLGGIVWQTLKSSD